METSSELEELKSFTHGMAASIHALAAYSHLRQRRWFHAAVHSAVALYDTISAFKHHKELT